MTDEEAEKQLGQGPWTNWPPDRSGGNSGGGEYDPAALELKADLGDLIQEARKKHTDKEVFAMGADENSVLVRKGRARSKADALLKPEVQGAMVSYAFGQADLAGPSTEGASKEHLPSRSP